MMKTNANNRPGCLASILSLFRRTETAQTQRQVFPYRVRDDFLSPAEFSFFKVLSSLVGSRMVIQSKVRLADIFFVARPNENISSFNRIAQRHIDFLLCTPTTMKPVLGIELDDSTHNNSTRQQRDIFVDQVFQAAGLPLLHIPAKREYNTQEVSDQISQTFNRNSTLPSSIPSPQNANSSMLSSIPNAERETGSVPICPKCGIPMVLRTATQGDHKGKQFYGCTNYPRCREVKPLT
jgi:hypothetical protein